MMNQKYGGSLFNENRSKATEQTQGLDVAQLVEIQVKALRDTYQVECLDAKQLQTVFNVGETNVYDWLKKCQAVRTIGRRKVVSVVVVANYLVTGNY